MASAQAAGGEAGFALQQVALLESEGRLVEAVDALYSANQELRDPRLEARLMELRRAAFRLMPRAAGEPAWPPPFPELPPGPYGFPVITPAELSADVVRGGVFGHGSLMVKGLFNARHVERFRHAIDAALDAFDATGAGTADETTPAWYTPMQDVGAAVGRGFVRQGGGVLTADSPRSFYLLRETLAELGIDRLVTEFLGERPAVSVEKCTLRRVKPVGGSGWHQDGAFLGADIRALNLWVTLSSCGRDAAGLDVVPCRIPRIVATGTEGAPFTWAVSQKLIDEEFAHLTVQRPEFEPGDAMFFDHLCLHRTALEPGMTETRYALENWFFAPSCYPDSQTGLCF